MPSADELVIRIVLASAPTLVPGADFGLQDQAQNVQVAAVGADGTLVFTCTLRLVQRADGYDFRGVYVHGKQGERFLYLSYGMPATDGKREWFQRWKLMLATLPTALIADAGERGVQATIHHLSGTRPALEWKLTRP